MGSSSRQFKALMRKNWINWKRSPKCSFCEICCASYIFLLLVWIRTLINVQTFDVGELAIARHPLLPTLWYNSTTSNWTLSEKVNEPVQNFTEYNRYPTNPQDPLGPRTKDYDARSDAFGFMGFIPTQCFKNNSFMIDKVEAPVIAVVGDSTEPASVSMVTYLKNLIGY